MASFTKYDADKDGMLNKREILQYAKAEHKFTVPDVTVERILTVLAQDGKGVRESDFHRLRVALGVAREHAKDEQRRLAREAHEKELAGQKDKAQGDIDGASALIKAAEQEVVEAGKKAQGLIVEAKSMKAIEMLEKAGEAEAFLQGVGEKVAVASKAVADCSVDDDFDLTLKPWFEKEKRRLQATVQTLETQSQRAATLLERAKADAARKDASEVKELSAKALMALKTHQTAQGLSSEALFAAIDAKGTGSFGADEFAAFIGGLPKVEGVNALTTEELRRAFAALDEERTGAVAKATFEAVFMVLMKVVKDVAVTDGCAIKDAKTLRRLEAGEVVLVLEGPVKDDQTDVQRVRGRAMQDGLEGWITVAGNQGSQFLKAGPVFKVVKDTILTDTFEIDCSKEDTRKIKVSTRKLKPGELLELRGWAKKQEDTGLTRMKVKVKSDGAIGYVTTLGNTGIKFVEVV